MTCPFCSVYTVIQVFVVTEDITLKSSQDITDTFWVPADNATLHTCLWVALYTVILSCAR